MTYNDGCDCVEKPLVWLHGEIKTPPFSREARIEAGALLRCLQRGETLSLPHSRPMSLIGARCHELRIQDQATTWRVIDRLDADAVIVTEIFAKKTEATPQTVVALCKRRLRHYDDAVEERDS